MERRYTKKTYENRHKPKTNNDFFILESAVAHFTKPAEQILYQW